MTERMVLAVASPHVDILGHCTGRLIGKRPPSVFDEDYVFAACAQFNTAVEINCRPERLDPPGELLEAAIQHRLSLLDRHRRPCHRAARMAASRLQPGGRTRRASRPDHQHPIGRRPPGVGGDGLSLGWSRPDRPSTIAAVGAARPTSLIELRCQPDMGAVVISLGLATDYSWVDERRRRRADAASEARPGRPPLRRTPLRESGRNEPLPCSRCLVAPSSPRRVQRHVQEDQEEEGAHAPQQGQPRQASEHG